MTRNEFVAIIALLRKNDMECSAITSAIESSISKERHETFDSLCIHNMLGSPALENGIVKILEDSFNDEECYISWYLYECDFGEKEPYIFTNGVGIRLNDGLLYDFLTVDRENDIFVDMAKKHLKKDVLDRIHLNDRVDIVNNDNGLCESAKIFSIVKTDDMIKVVVEPDTKDELIKFVYDEGENRFKNPDSNKILYEFVDGGRHE